MTKYYICDFVLHEYFCMSVCLLLRLLLAYEQVKLCVCSLCLAP